MERRILLHPERLRHEYVPPELPRREEQRRSAFEHFRVFFERGDRFTSISIVGNAGMGKTVLSRRVGTDLQEEIPRVRVLYVNCYLTRNPFKTLVDLVRQLTPAVPSRGLSQYEVMDLFIRTLNELRYHALIILDEIDKLFTDRAQRAREMLYMLSRLEEHEEWRTLNVSIGVIATSRDEAWAYKWLDSATRASFVKRVMRLPDYTKDDLFEILRYRAELALRPGSFTDEVIEFIADYTADHRYGNARIAIDLLTRAAEIAEAEGVSEILPEHVRLAISEISYASDIDVDPEVLYNLGKHKLVILLSIIRALRSLNKAYVTRRELQPFYEQTCEEYGERPRKTTQFLKYLKELGRELSTILSVVVSGKGQRGRSTRISVNAPLDALEKVVTRMLEGQM